MQSLRSHQFQQISPLEMVGKYSIEISQNGAAWDGLLFEPGSDEPIAAAHGDSITVFEELMDAMMNNYKEKS